MIRRLLISILLAATQLAGEPVAMVDIPGGSYLRPLERDAKPRTVAPFQLDTRCVTNAEFLEFVKAHPCWQRSRVNRLFADQRYLYHWKSDLELGPLAPPEAPVTHVSWFAARAFLKPTGKRLPTVDEWEFVARASATSADATSDPEFRRTILDWYGRPNPDVIPNADSPAPNFYGVRGMHGLVWEWTRDFVSAMATGESRADGSPDSGLFCGGAGLNTNQATEYADFMRFAFRSSLKGSFCVANLGFRGAKAAPSPKLIPTP